MQASGKPSPMSVNASHPTPTTKKSNEFQAPRKNWIGPAATHVMASSIVNRNVKMFSATRMFELRGESEGSVGSANASRIENALIMRIEIFPNALELAMRFACFWIGPSSRSSFCAAILFRLASAS
jgi:hypothetical protein